MVHPYHLLLAGGLSYVFGLGHANHNTTLIFTEKERNTSKNTKEEGGGVGGKDKGKVLTFQRGHIMTTTPLKFSQGKLDSKLLEVRATGAG